MNNELQHHGVKGMKWGVRKDRRTGSTRTADRSKTAVVVKPKGAIRNRSERIRDAYMAGKKQVESRFDKKTLDFVSDASAYAAGALWLASAFTGGQMSVLMNSAAALTNMVSMISDRD